MVACLSTAIEKAMVYLDTGGLPWDMELFTFKTSEVVPATQTPHRTPEKMESEDSAAEMNAFMDKLKKFHESKGMWDAPLGQFSRRAGAIHLSASLRGTFVVLLCSVIPRARPSFRCIASNKSWVLQAAKAGAAWERCYDCVCVDDCGLKGSPVSGTLVMQH